MARGPKATGAMTALLIALPFGLMLAWTQRTAGPSRAELATTLSHGIGGPVVARDIEALRCDEGASIGYQCRWRQRVDEIWQERTGHLAVDTQGWHLVDRPSEGQ